MRELTSLYFTTSVHLNKRVITSKEERLGIDSANTTQERESTQPLHQRAENLTESCEDTRMGMTQQQA